MDEEGGPSENEHNGEGTAGNSTNVDGSCYDDEPNDDSPFSRLRRTDELATDAAESGDVERALLLRMQGIALAQICMDEHGNQKPPLVAKAHLDLSSTYLLKGFGEQALMHAHKAMEWCDPRRWGSNTNPHMVPQALKGLAQARLQMGRPGCATEALKFLRRALSASHALYGEEDEANATIHEAFADVYIYVGDRKARVGSLDGGGGRRGKGKSSRRMPSEDDVDVEADAEEGLDGGEGRDDANTRYEKAMNELYRAWELIDNAQSRPGAVGKTGVFGSKHPSMGPLYTKMAQTRIKQGRDEEASSVYERAMDVYEASESPNRATLAQLSYELGVTHYKLERYSDALAALEKAGNLYKTQGGGDASSHPIILKVLQHKGLAFFKSNDLPSAERSFRELLDLQRSKIGNTALPIAETLKYLGNVSVGMEKLRTACNCYEKALKIIRKHLGYSHPKAIELNARIHDVRALWESMHGTSDSGNGAT